MQFELKIENISFKLRLQYKKGSVINREFILKKIPIKVMEEIKYFSRIFNSIFSPSFL